MARLAVNRVEVCSGLSWWCCWWCGVGDGDSADWRRRRAQCSRYRVRSARPLLHTNTSKRVLSVGGFVTRLATGNDNATVTGALHCTPLPSPCRLLSLLSLSSSLTSAYCPVRRLRCGASGINSNSDIAGQHAGRHHENTRLDGPHEY